MNKKGLVAFTSVVVLLLGGTFYKPQNNEETAEKKEYPQIVRDTDIEKVKPKKEVEKDEKYSDKKEEKEKKEDKYIEEVEVELEDSGQEIEVVSEEYMELEEYDYEEEYFEEYVEEEIYEEVEYEEEYFEQSYASGTMTFDSTAYAVGEVTTPNTFTRDGTDVSNTIYSPEGYRIIAVDPSVIPMGSLVEVTLSSGETFVAKASDTGGAIVGNIIDILVSSIPDADSYGRQEVQIRILN